VSFEVGAAEVVGLIGPNGAGKTTLLECVAGLQRPDSGKISAAPGSTFFVPDGITPWESQPAGWALRFVAALHGASSRAVPAIVEELSLSRLLDRPIGLLSRGQRKRLLVAFGLLTTAPLLLLDEPFDGLDLRQVRDVATVLRRHAAAGRALMLSIHQLSDAARVCDRVVLLSGGKVAGAGTLDELRTAAHLPGADLEEIFLALA
jgi:ABC-2 type transport system ATP-binding protein